MIRLKTTKGSILIFCLILSTVLFSGCRRDADSAPVSVPVAEETADSSVPALRSCGVIHEPEFGGIYIKMTIEDFGEFGFDFGDSVDLSFSNGFSLEDLPYYNGFYSKTGEPLLIGYPGYEYIKAVVYCGGDLWEIAGLSENDTADIILAEKGKYADIQSARDLHYTDDPEDYESEQVFANFRNVRAGTIAEDTLYRSASPCDNQHNRAGYVDKLIEEAKVNYILDLADDDEKIRGYLNSGDTDSPYFRELYDRGSVAPLSLNMDFSSERFKEGVKKCIASIAENEGPYLVNCTEGKDRTGFVCMLLEALCDADYEEIVSDYMETYSNYYHFDEKTDSSRYSIIVREVLDPMIQVIAGENADVKNANLREGAEQYLNGLGVDGEIISIARRNLTETAVNEEPSGKEVAVDPATLRKMNIFLSNFSEAWLEKYDKDNPDNFSLCRWVHIWFKINKYEKIEYETRGDDLYEKISLEEINKVFDRYLGITLSEAEISGIEPPSADYGEFFYEDGYLYATAADGESYTNLSIVSGVEDIGDNRLKLNFDIYSQDLDLYFEGKEKDGYYSLTADEASDDLELEMWLSGYAVVRDDGSSFKLEYLEV